MEVFSSINFKFALNPSTRIDNKRVEAFSSSFLSQVPLSKFSYALPPPPSSPPLLHISAAGLEEKQTLLTTETHLPKYQNPPPNTKSTHANKATSLATRTFNVLDEISNNFINRPLKQSVDPQHVLSNNYAPVDELPPTECEVVYGTLPACLNGVYIRNGPNPQFIPHGPYHLFDGDGMLHAITISGGRATFCSRYVKTYKYTVENEAGSPFIPSVFSSFSSGLMASAVRVVVTAARALARQFDSSKGIGTANTSLALVGGKLFALVECDKPYAIKVLSDGDVVTLGRHDFDGKLVKNMTAHPKIDLDTGETFAFRCNIMPPFLAYFRFTEKGEKEMDVPIFSITRLPLLHDFAITKKYAIFVETQTEMNLMKMTTGGLPMALDPKKVPRIGIIPRYAEDESEMKWFEVPGYNIIHAINAWDEDDGDTVVLVAPNILSVEHMLERLHLSHALVEKVRIDLKTGMVTRLPLAVRNLEFGVINPKFVGKKSRYIYAAIGGPHLKVIGVVKLDISVSESDGCDCTVGCRMFGPGCYGGEPYFVAKDPNNSKADEDDGYVITYVHNENSRESQFLVMDAKSPNLDIVAAVKLPRRVPCGFHGLFVHKSDLSKL